MRNGLQSVSAEMNGRHPLEARLKNWDETQQALKMESLMRVYGAQEPIRRGMEMKISGSVSLLGLPGNLRGFRWPLCGYEMMDRWWEKR
jgi:proteasome maturation protein